ncbi:MAG: SRPBCC family protein [Chloroflexi bacterium]|nr:SRPBCC family protein [Chloroflexota bacterium]
MTLIDQRILVPAPIQAVWGVIANHSQLPRWRQDCKAVSLLSTRADGVGMRRRVTPAKGKDFIEETIAWYDGVGYEYRLIDGANQFKSYTARLRLQPTPDGTIVQWTMSFETRGPLGKILGNRRRRRKLEKASAESLRQLRRYIEGMGIKVDDQYREKVGIRSSPDANSRQEYGAKLAQQQTPTGTPIVEAPLPAQSSQPTQPAQSTHNNLGIVEPPIKPDDTPSIRPVAPPSFIVEALMTPLPTSSPTAKPTGSSEIRKSQEMPVIATPPVDKDEDTRPNPAVVVGQAPNAPVSKEPSPAKNVTSEVAPPQPLSKPLDPAKSDELKAAFTTAKVSMPPLPRPIVEEVEREIPPHPDLPPPTGKLDTGEMSIWDVFGMRPPSIEPSPAAESPRPETANKTEPPAPTALPEVVTDAVLTATSAKTTSRSSTLDAWLAATEPPLPPSASGTIKTFARVPQSHTAGLRLRQRQRRLKVRPLKSSENPNGDQVTE